MEHNYKLSDEQWLTANHFAEAYKSLAKAGIKIILEEDSDTLCLVNGKDVTFGYVFPNCIQESDTILDMQNVNTDDICCLGNDIIPVSPGEILSVTKETTL